MNKIITSILMLLVAGCSLGRPVVDESVNHLLDSIVPERTPTKAQPAIAIAAPSLPPYLDRKELVTRGAEGQMTVHDNQLWSEPLDASIARIVAENLRSLTGSTNIQPAKNFVTRDYSALVEMRIDRFEPAPDGQLLLECTWKLQPTDGSVTSPEAFRTSVAIATTGSAPMAGRVAAMNEALARLSRKIAAKL